MQRLNVFREWNDSYQYIGALDFTEGDFRFSYNREYIDLPDASALPKLAP